MRQLWVLFLKSLAVVSIHAPWEGCDLQDAVILHLMSVSIHAPWEGCDADYLTYAPVKVVSIHAPWEGCDSFRLFISFAHHTFQFTHPGKGATLTTSLKRTAITFQFTHPGKGATRLEQYDAIECAIVSIHAPWEGCDYLGLGGV